jgi:outer membrane protein assembly factor BamB
LRPGLEAGLGSRLLEARRAFEDVLGAEPGSAAARALARGAAAGLARAQALSEERLAHVAPTRIRLPTSPPALAPAGASPPTLKMLRQARNKVTDVEAWMRAHDVKLAELGAAPGRLPQEIAPSYRGEALRRAIGHADHRVLVYGQRYVVVTGLDGGLLAAFDATDIAEVHAPPMLVDGLALAARAVPLEIRWAEAQGTTLYLETSHAMYARDTGGLNAFVWAVELPSGRVRWRSAPLVANGRNFLVRGDHLVSGYGFTAERDALFVLDGASGATLRRFELGSAPDLLHERGGVLYVRGYDVDYEIAIGPASARVPVAGLTPVGRAEPPALPADARCRLAAAIDELEARRYAVAEEALAALTAAHPAVPLLAQLRAEVVAERERTADPSAIDLAGSRPVAVVAPWHSALVAPAAPPPARPTPRLTELASTPSAPDDAAWLATNGLESPLLRPADPFGRPSEVPASIPDAYGVEPLRYAYAYADHRIAVYGGRYVAVARRSEAPLVLDLAALRLPPRRTGGLFADVEQDAIWAEVRGTTLFVANGGGSYAREVFGQKGFVTAVELPSGRVLWRSEPLVAHFGFVLWEGFLVTGYGFTDETDHLYVLEQATGKTVARHPLPSAPSYFFVKGDRLFVRAYLRDLVFSLR